LRPERVKEVERIASADLRPGYLDRLQFITDSARAQFWFKKTNDSNYLKKYLRKDRAPVPSEPAKNPVPETIHRIGAVMPDKLILKKRVIA
jgi:penicillin-binding protein 2